MSKKGEKQPAPETKGAMQDLLNELDQTRREYAKLSLQLTQQESMIQHLKDAESQKDQVLAYLQDELQRVHQIHKQEISVQHEESKSCQMELEHKVKYLELEVSRLTEENNIYSGFEKENRQLRETLMQHQAVIEKLQNINEDLKTRTNTEMTDFRTQLEVEFKRRLADAEKRFRAEAYRALSEEAKIALQGNDHLQIVLQRQNDSIEGVLARCKQLESSHERIKTEQELAQQNLVQHQNEVARLRKQLSDSRAKNTQLEEALRQRRVERASLELLYMEYEATRKEMAKAQAACKRAQREAERWRQRAIALSNDLGTHDSKQFEDLTRRQERVDEQLRREKLRRERRNRLREKRAETAALYEGQEAMETGVTTDPTSSDYDGVSEEDPDIRGSTAGSRHLNPMEIFAMWNVNFEAWQDTRAEEGLSPESPSTTAGRPSSGPPAAGTPGHYDGDAEDTAAAEDQDHKPAPPREKRQTRKTAPTTTSQARLEADRNLSVLSKRRVRALPPQPQQFAASRRHQSTSGFPVADTLHLVNADGEFTTKKVGAQAPSMVARRYIVP